MTGTSQRPVRSDRPTRLLTRTLNDINDLPPSTGLSDQIAADLKRRGFKFLGSIVMYSHMQATGIVNDHVTSCFRHDEVNRPFDEALRHYPKQ